MRLKISRGKKLIKEKRDSRKKERKEKKIEVLDGRWKAGGSLLCLKQGLFISLGSTHVTVDLPLG